MITTDASQRIPRLPARRGSVLRVIVADYVEKASPVGSEHIARAHSLGVSSATIRNEMAALEEEGYITHPHTSAGRVPSDKGYRYFIEVLMEEDQLPPDVKERVRQRIRGLEGERDEWAVAATALAAQLVEAVALLTFPRARSARLKHLELVSLQDFLALLVLVFHEAKVKQQLLHLDEAATQDELSTIANRLNAFLAGATAREIGERSPMLTPIEAKVTRTVTRIMESEDAAAIEVAQLGGLRTLLAQPEFNSGQRTLELMDLLEDRRSLGALLGALAPSEDEVRVVIGSENPIETMHDLSLVLAPYGIPGQMAGTIGILGPTRLRYPRAIAVLQHLSRVMSETLAENYG